MKGGISGKAAGVREFVRIDNISKDGTKIKF
jgi:hypothetical protein